MREVAAGLVSRESATSRKAFQRLIRWQSVSPGEIVFRLKKELFHNESERASGDYWPQDSWMGRQVNM
jgi:hypothetical protein